MNTPVSYAIAKLLKEKGFDDECKYYYDENEELTFHIGYIGDIWKNSEIKDGLPYTKENSPCISAPTIADVVMWLYEKHGIWIEIIETDLFQKYFFQLKRKDGTRLKDGDFDTPSESYEAAFEYALNKLI